MSDDSSNLQKYSEFAMNDQKTFPTHSQSTAYPEFSSFSLEPKIRHIRNDLSINEGILLIFIDDQSRIRIA